MLRVVRAISLFIGIFLSAFPAFPATDVPRTFVLLEEGAHLTLSGAANLETRLQKSPNNLEDRLQLLSFYARQPSGLPPETLRAARLRHVEWLIEHEPKAAVFLVATRVYAIQKTGGPLADQAGFEAVENLWKSQISAHDQDSEIKGNAASVLDVQDPEFAAQLLVQLGETRRLGQIYAKAILGIVATDYLSSDPALADDVRRQSPFAKQALAQLEASNDPRLLGGAAFSLCRDGGILYADGKLDFDYTPLARTLITKTETMDPSNADAFAAVPVLPAKGLRPPITVQIGGPVANKNLISQIEPAYPPEAKASRIQGAVALKLLIGLDGHVIKVALVKGPDQLQRAAIDAVRQWIYRPTTVGGKPVYVTTNVEVRFQLK